MRSSLDLSTLDFSNEPLDIFYLRQKAETEDAKAQFQLSIEYATGKKFKKA